MTNDLIKRLDALVEDLGEGRACWGSEYIDAAVDATYRIEQLVATCSYLEKEAERLRVCLKYHTLYGFCINSLKRK